MDDNKSKQPETFQPVSRGLIKHLPYMSDALTTMFLYCLLRVDAIGPNKGKFSDSAEEIGKDLAWDRRKVYSVLKKGDVYLDVKYPRSRHGTIQITVRNYKNAKDFYRSKKTDSKADSKRTVDGQYTDSRRTVTQENLFGDKDLQNRNKGIRGKGDKGKGKRAHTPFKKPSVEEVLAYCQERRNSIDAEKFVSHYNSNGWMVGKTKMVDWKSAVITWELNQKRRGDEPTAEDRMYGYA